MDNFIQWILDNKEWVFSGIGVFVIGLVIALFRRTSKSKGDTIVTHGNQSPGKVGGNYTANSNDRKEN